MGFTRSLVVQCGLFLSLWQQALAQTTTCTAAGSKVLGAIDVTDPGVVTTDPDVREPADPAQCLPGCSANRVEVKFMTNLLGVATTSSQSKSGVSFFIKSFAHRCRLTYHRKSPWSSSSLKQPALQLPREYFGAHTHRRLRRLQVETIHTQNVAMISFVGKLACSLRTCAYAWFTKYPNDSTEPTFTQNGHRQVHCRRGNQSQR